MDINQALSICLKKDIKVYPIYKNYKWYICKEEYGKKTIFNKEVAQNYINEAVTKTYINEAEKIEK